MAPSDPLRRDVPARLAILELRAAGTPSLTPSDRVVLAYLVAVMRAFEIEGTGAQLRIVADHTGLTIYAVRKALQRFATTGLLDVEPGRGTLPSIVRLPGLVTP